MLDTYNISNNFKRILGFLPWYQCWCWFTQDTPNARPEPVPLIIYFTNTLSTLTYHWLALRCKINPLSHFQQALQTVLNSLCTTLLSASQFTTIPTSNPHNTLTRNTHGLQKLFIKSCYQIVGCNRVRNRIGICIKALFSGSCPHRDRDYCIQSNFWKFYLIKTGFTLGGPVSLVKMFWLFKLEQMFFGVPSVDTVGRCTASYLLAGPACLWRLVLY
jgi:hypothetical protein